MSRGAVRWSAQAERALKDIVSHIAQNSSAQASAFAGRLFAKVSRLGEFPESGRVVPELAELENPPREVIVGEYRVLYRLVKGGVEIAIVIHGRRLLPLEG